MIPAVSADGSLYPVEKLEAHSRALLHLAVSIFIFRGPELLIQRRARSKYHCGGLWANSCCSHPDWGEDARACAARRMAEELGFAVPLTDIGEVEYRAEVGDGLFEHERVTFFRGDYGDQRIEPDPSEVMEFRGVDRGALERELAASPGRFAPWLRIYARRHGDLIFSR